MVGNLNAAEGWTSCLDGVCREWVSSSHVIEGWTSGFDVVRSEWVVAHPVTLLLQSAPVAGRRPPARILKFSLPIFLSCSNKFYSFIG